jgi:hypothetical protein
MNMFTTELDINYETPKSEIVKFALEHMCEATLITENGPGGGNPVYEFSSHSYDCLEELVTQVYGVACDEEFLKTIIVEV